MPGFRFSALLVAPVCALLASLAIGRDPPDPHAILAEEGRIVSSQGIDESRAIDLGGIRQWITVRGRDRRNPFLLLLHGGPAAPDLANRYLFEAPWTDYFTVVQWDQRGAGKTFAMNDPETVAPTMHKERMVEDAVELVAWLRATYGRDRIFVMGHSWGTVLGMELALRRPQWLYAYIGAGQIIDMREGERVGYEWARETARKAGEAVALRELDAIAPYPEEDGAIPLAKIGIERKWVVQFGGLTHGRRSYAYWEDPQRLSPDYSERDFRAIDEGSAFSLPRLLPELARTDFSAVRRIGCPLILFAGRFDYTTPNEPVRRWFDRLEAPGKKWIWFENSAHMMYAEEPGRVLVHLVEDALPLATETGR